jgi:hypothetical protein
MQISSDTGRQKAELLIRQCNEIWCEFCILTPDLKAWNWALYYRDSVRLQKIITTYEDHHVPLASIKDIFRLKLPGVYWSIPAGTLTLSLCMARESPTCSSWEISRLDLEPPSCTNLDHIRFYCERCASCTSHLMNFSKWVYQQAAVSYLATHPVTCLHAFG